MQDSNFQLSKPLNTSDFWVYLITKILIYMDPWSDFRSPSSHLIFGGPESKCHNSDVGLKQSFLKMAALSSLNLHLINGQWRLLYKLRILSIPYFINLQILPSKEWTFLWSFESIFKGYAFIFVLLWRVGRSQNHVRQQNFESTLKTRLKTDNIVIKYLIKLVFLLKKWKYWKC